mgnify:CR=1 FL=1
MTQLVLIDTSAWISFFQKRNDVAQVVQSLILNNRVARCGMVELELRLGFKHDESALLSLFMSCTDLSTTSADFTKAGEVLGKLRRGGRTLPASDGLIAAIAVRHGVPLLADDTHFDYYPKLKLFRE